jgi:hypothetical protein
MMRVEIDPLFKLPDPLFGEEGQVGDFVKICKVIYWPNGRVHSKYGLSFITGEWIMVPEGQAYPTECIMGPELRELLNPERKQSFANEQDM